MGMMGMKRMQTSLLMMTESSSLRALRRGQKIYLVQVRRDISLQTEKQELATPQRRSLDHARPWTVGP
jgi:hypothetical protein